MPTELERKIIVSDRITIIQKIDSEADIATISSEAVLLNKIINAAKSVNDVVSGVLGSAKRGRGFGPKRKYGQGPSEEDYRMVNEFNEAKTREEKHALAAKHGFKDYTSYQKGIYYRKRVIKKHLAKGGSNNGNKK